MKFDKIISEFANTDLKEFEKTSGRRELLKNAGSKAILASIPVLASSLFNKASAQTSGTGITSALNFALQLEYMEYAFFRTGNNTGGLIPTADQAGFLAIETHALSHINFLNTTITNLGGTPFLPNNYNNNPYVPAAYDFTAGGVYDIYNNAKYYLYLDLAQVIEDICIRAYNGLIQQTSSSKTVLTSLLQIQSVKGRHASHVRYVRRFTNNAPDYPKPWITNNISFYFSPVDNFQPFYIGEDNVVQNSTDVTTLPAVTGTLSETAATEAFDEPMDQTTVLNLLKQFML